jgi:hypothetical protein
MQDIIGDQIAFYIAWDEKDANNEGTNPIIRQAARARLAILKTAPRDIPLLKLEIAKKTKAFNSCETFPERDILQVELDALQSILPLLNLVKYGGPEAGFTTIEKEAEKSQALMRLRQENIDLL